jgi:hypothetical protein
LPEASTRFVEIAVGQAHGCGIKESREFVCFFTPTDLTALVLSSSVIVLSSSVIEEALDHLRGCLLDGMRILPGFALGDAETLPLRASVEGKTG